MEETHRTLGRRERQERWSKPPLCFVKCNIGSSWSGPNNNSGAAWILRDDQGKTILHSRRAFSQLKSGREAEFNPVEFIEHHSISGDINRLLLSLQDWSITHILQTKNTIARDIATSVTLEHRYHLYIACGGPTWLMHRLEEEAQALSQGDLF